MTDSVASRQRFWLVFLLFLHTVNTYMDRVCISAAKDSMQNDITGLDDQMIGYVFGIFAVGYALFQIPAGWFSDRAGPRHALTVVVIVWSIFTALTGAVFTAVSLLVVRFLFGVGEAGAYPGATRALYSWLPAKERGLGQGIFHSGARVGAAASLVLMPWLIDQIGWRWTFVANAVIGLVWGGVWWVWYRNEPSDHKKVNQAEVELIQKGIAEEPATTGGVPYIQIVTSANVLLAMFQYAASNITFFISITWLQPYIKETWGEEFAWLASLPLLGGAVALWLSGWLVTTLHGRGMPVGSRRLPAMIGSSMGAIGLLLCTQTVESESVWPFIACFSLATFGVEMTLSPSWAFCMDIGGSRSGAVSAAMNMVGNLGAALSAVAFPFFVANVTLPLIAEKTGTAGSFFVFAATMNTLAVVAWLFMNPRRELVEVSASALKKRLALFVGLILFVVSALVYTKFLMPKEKPEPKKTTAEASAPYESREGAKNRRPPSRLRALARACQRNGDSLMSQLKGVAVGAGYFSQFHFEAWSRLNDVELTGICDIDEEAARRSAALFGIQTVYSDFEKMLDAEQPDFVDIITRPDSHRELTRLATERGIAVICQKPLAPTIREAQAIVAVAESAGVPLMVHENFRFQPWYREVRRLLDAGTIGSTLHSISFRMRTGDGAGPDAYLARQPYFQAMPRFLLHETGVHFIDTFRFLGGEVDDISAVLRRLNPVIAGEDAGLLTFRFANGAVGLWDANRCNESSAADPRYTFGTLLVEADGGSIRLDEQGRLFVKPLGGSEVEHGYDHERRGFAGDCVYFTQKHFVECLRSGTPFETSGSEYMKTLQLVEAAYESAGSVASLNSAEGRGPLTPALSPTNADESGSELENEVIAFVGERGHARSAQSRRTQIENRRIVDLSLPLENGMRGVDISVATTIADKGWNSTTLSLYSHCGTHMDAPKHFLGDEGATIDQQDLSVCCGPAKVVDLTPVEPSELLTVERLSAAVDVEPGDRLLLRTDWSHRLGTDAYRDALPRISRELARWLVEQEVALVGVEAPSVADVNDLPEVTEVHQTLFRGGVVIVEGLVNLDQLTLPIVEFIALPLKVTDGDGSPVRAIAIESPEPR